MKIVINRRYGSFSLSKEAAQILEVNPYNYDDEFRENQGLINLIERQGSDFVSGRYADLEIVDIPDAATDYEIEEFDGMERVIYVLDGKIHHA